jgi:hypothetical protein
MRGSGGATRGGISERTLDLHFHEGISGLNRQKYEDFFKAENIPHCPAGIRKADAWTSGFHVALR